LEPAIEKKPRKPRAPKDAAAKPKAKAKAVKQKRTLIIEDDEE
jgi:hypothetical protein